MERLCGIYGNGKGKVLGEVALSLAEKGVEWVSAGRRVGFLALCVLLLIYLFIYLSIYLFFV